MNAIVDALEQPKAMAVTFGGELAELSDETLSDIALYADVAELRADKLPDHSAEYLRGQVRRLGAMPVLFTMRMAKEGGGWQNREEQRLPIYTAVAEAVEGADVENASAIRDDVIALYGEQGKAMVVSFHDLEGTPEQAELEDRFAEAREAIGEHAGYAKLAVTLNSMADFRNLVDFNQAHDGERIILVGMDNPELSLGLGAEFRKHASHLGLRLSYAHSGHGPVAPGQFHYLEMAKILGKS